MTGPKMILDQVIAAEQAVIESVNDMEAVAKGLQSQSLASLTAMQAPAGKITSANYEAHSGAGKALAETLYKLKTDLTTTRAVLMAGSEDATGVANRVVVDGGGGGGGGSAGNGISRQM